MRAAKNISYGAGLDNEGKPVSYEIAAGAEIPEEILDEIPEDLILEMVAQDSPDTLSREQLMVLAGITTGPDSLEPIEYDEDSLRTALTELRTKSDLVDWFMTVRPTSEQPDPKWSRNEIVDFIVEEMVGE